MTARCLVPIALGLLLAAPACAQELTVPLLTTFENPKYQAFHDHVAGRLEGAVVDGKIVVEATRAAGSGKVMHLDFGEQGTKAVFADVMATFATPTNDTGLLEGPGILIRDGNINDTRGYLALLLQRDGYLIIALSGGGLRQSVGGSLDAATLAKPVRLSARETANGGAEFFVNGERVAGVSDSSVGGRRIGLIAFGSGTFSFDNLGLNSKGDTGVPDGPTGPAPVGGSTPPPLPGPAVSPNAPAATPSPNAPPPN